MSRPFVEAEELRERFSRAMSHMYRAEVPAYGTLVDLVEEVNARTLLDHPELKASLSATESLARVSEERHGAIRLGTAAELSMMRRAFAVMGMFPVGYYDLSVAGIPVHSTAFRPIEGAALRRNPFRVFTSLLRLELINDQDLRVEAERTLAQRRIFSNEAIRLVEKAEAEGGLSESDAEPFIREVLNTFRWHDRAVVSNELYGRLHHAHRLVADVVSFHGPHINHLTPRTLDIDLVQELMPTRGITPKEVVEGPPCRRCPILLRQTSFKALEEPISFKANDGSWIAGTHTARFGEIEQRGAALTRKGRALYDRLLDYSRSGSAPHHEQFSAFPDDYGQMRREGLAHFEYVLTDQGRRSARSGGAPGRLDDYVAQGLVAFHPITYEDFLPVSAAGIFRSNLGADVAESFAAGPSREAFENALGAAVQDEFDLYAALEDESIQRCMAKFSRASAA